MAGMIINGLQLVSSVKSLWDGIAHPSHNKAATQSTAGTSSDFATMLAAAMQKANTNTATATTAVLPTLPGNPIQTRLAGLTADFQAKVAQFRTELGNVFSKLGIPQLPTLDLTLGTDGHVTVANDNPAKDQIDAVFQSHPLLENAFQQLAVQGSMLRTAVDDFQLGGFASNPVGAASAYATQIAGDNSPANWHLVLGPTGISTYFGTSSSSSSSGTTA